MVFMRPIASPQIKIAQGAYLYMPEEDFPAAYEAFEEAIQLSEKTSDIVSSFFANPPTHYHLTANSIKLSIT